VLFVSSPSSSRSSPTGCPVAGSRNRRLSC